MYLDGFWQSERYFSEIASTVRTELAPRFSLSTDRQSILAEIGTSNAVSVHVRRGDYTTPKNLVKHGVCSSDYYQDALAVVKSRVTEPHCFVFSDDPEWAREHLKLDMPVSFVSPPADGRDYEDFVLMSSCRHHVIANSTFSWWAAWLSASHDKLIVAPKQWFAGSEYDARDIVPEGWIRV